MCVVVVGAPLVYVCLFTTYCMENPNIKSLREFKKILKYIENVNNFFKKNIEFPLRTYEFNNSYMNNFIYISCGAGSSMEFKTKIRFESEFDDSLLESIIRNDNESLRVSKSSSGLITYLKNENLFFLQYYYKKLF